MPIPRAVAAFNRRIANPLIRPLAARLPYFGVVTHRGRRSGARYRTPVNVFRHDGWVVIPLTYGAGSDWVRNVLAARGCILSHRGRELHLGRPELVRGEQGARLLPGPVRRLLRLLDVDRFLRLEVAP